MLAVGVAVVEEIGLAGRDDREAATHLRVDRVDRVDVRQPIGVGHHADVRDRELAARIADLGEAVVVGDDELGVVFLGEAGADAP